MAAAGLLPRKIQGRRYTDDATLGIVVQSLLQDTNASIVTGIRKLGGRAVGLHTGSLQCLFGQPMTLPSPEGPIDLGHVGNVDRVDVGLIEDFCAARVVPVIPSLAVDEATGGWLNVNADTAAAAVAAQLRVEKLVFLTDTPGILMNRHDPTTLLSNLDAAACNDLIQRGIIDAGMIPKVEACIDCLRAGVRKTHMVDGRQRHAILLEIFTQSGIGTEIVLGS
jgi:acetylglutamate kinase